MSKQTLIEKKRDIDRKNTDSKDTRTRVRNMVDQLDKQDLRQVDVIIRKDILPMSLN